MRDSAADVAIVRRVLAGEPTGYADLYDRYAAPLHAYCYSMLGDQERAVRALGVTFMIAACRLGELRDSTRLRPWLYALARNECRRRAYGRPGSGLAWIASADTGHARNAEQAQDGGDGSEPSRADNGEPLAAAEPGRAEVLGAAMRGLSPDDREAAELCLLYYLTGSDLADILGMSAGRTYAAVTRARFRLRRALGTLLVARWGRKDCPDLDGMLAGWDGRATMLMSQRVRRHIGCCDTCRNREWREMPAGALAEMLAEAAQSDPPPGLRDHLLRLLAETKAGTATEGVLIADLVAHRAGSFGSSGFPARPPRRGNWRTDHSLPVAGAAACVAAAGVVIVLSGVIPGRGTPSAELIQAAVASSTGGASAPRTGAGGGSVNATPTPTPAPDELVPAVTPAVPVHGITPQVLTGGPSTLPASLPVGNGSPTLTASPSSPAPSPSKSPSKSPSPSPSKSSSPSTSPTTSPSSTTSSPSTTSSSSTNSPSSSPSSTAATSSATP